MSKAIEDRNDEIYRAIVDGKQSFGEVAKKWGLTRQSVWAIIQMKERKLSGQTKQGELVDRIIYPGVQNWIVHNSMTIRYFCEFVCSDSVSTAGAIRRFLNGETGGNIRIIKDILQATGMTFEQAFMENNTITSTNCTSESDRTDCIDIKELGFNLKEEREKRGLNQREIAQKLGISLQAYYRWEQGLTKQIKRENYNRLLKIFSSITEITDTETEEHSFAHDSDSSKDIKETIVKRNIYSRDRYRSLSDLGIDLFEEHINRGWSQREVAEKLGVSILSYCRWETGKTLKVSHKNYKAIQRVFLNIE